jgi:hypothetical protein
MAAKARIISSLLGAANDQHPLQDSALCGNKELLLCSQLLHHH